MDHLKCSVIGESNHVHREGEISKCAQLANLGQLNNTVQQPASAFAFYLRQGARGKSE